MRTLERITISGYKSIKQASLQLGDLNVLIGANGAGKSNFLSAFKLLRNIIDRKLQLLIQDAGGANRLLYFGRKVTDKITIRLTFDTGQIFLGMSDGAEPRREKGDYGVSLIPTQQDSLQIAKEYGDILKLPDYDPMPPVTFAEGQLETGIYEARLPWVGKLITLMPHHGVYHFQDTGVDARIKQNNPLNDNQFLREDARNLAAFLYSLQVSSSVSYSRIVNTVRLAAPYIKDFILRPSPVNPDFIRFECSHKESEEYFDISQLSDGTLRFICLTTLLLQPNPPSLIIIDEPELGLHPAAIELLIEMLRSASVKSQVIISTQSVEMVRQFSPEEIIVVDRKNDESVFTRKNSQELAMWLDEYNMGELWEMNVIGGRP